jgi:hypothetical protein
MEQRVVYQGTSVLMGCFGTAHEVLFGNGTCDDFMGYGPCDGFMGMEHVKILWSGTCGDFIGMEYVMIIWEWNM